MDEEKLLLAEYDHFGDGIFKNEEIGERRIEFFLTIATATLGGVVLLLTAKEVKLSNDDVRKVALAALLTLFVIGLVTFLRILQRDRVTDEYKAIQRYLREQLRQRSPALTEYALPFIKTRRHKLLRGGIALTMAMINSVVLAFIAAVWAADSRHIAAFTIGSFLLSATGHAVAIGRRSVPQESSQFYRAGAGAVIVNSAGQVLAMKRKQMADAWQLPQGGLEIGESPLEAVLREIREETGIARNNLRQLISEPVLLVYELPPEFRSAKTGRGQVHHWFLFRLEGSHVAPSSGDGKEFDAWKWTTLEQLASEVVPFRRAVYQQLLKEWAKELEPQAANAGSRPLA